MIVVRGTTPREVAPLLLEELRERDPEKAAWFDDVWAEVFKALRHDNCPDVQMANDLVKSLVIHLNKVAPEGQVFEAREDVWGYWDLVAVIHWP